VRRGAVRRLPARPGPSPPGTVGDSPTAVPDKAGNLRPEDRQNGDATMAVSMRDVAARAGVSPRTVSNVVSGYVHVRAETRERVQRAIDELRYRPNLSARSLRQGRTGIIALAVPEIAAPYFAELGDLIQRQAGARGVTLLVDQTGASRQRELLVLDGYRSHVIDGLILSPMAITVEDLEAQESDIPTVLLGERIHHGGLLHVAIDNEAAAREATAHLIDTGRRRIAAVGTEPAANTVGPALRRMRGYLAALDDAGLEAAPELVVATGGWARAAGYAAVDALLRGGTDVDALFCFNDVLALGALRAISDHGLRVPDDIAVVGCDDIEDAAYSTPSLTSISPDKATIAKTAVDRLLAQVAGEPVPAEEVTCSFTLIVRESTTSVRRRGRPSHR
jgi:DNA-binding LacI/PurR family transcriptional regulator